ncbi:MAG TPA: hypothetical protein VFE27_22200 [Acidobacteriaceae bacterium]|nr:hypothetical protein [Acidobacteriaceae bacterium]
MAACPIGLDGTPVSLRDGILIRGRLQYLAGKFMAQYPRISVDRMGTPVSMKITPANTHTPHPDQRMAGFWEWLRNLALCKFTRSL